MAELWVLDGLSVNDGVSWNLRDGDIDLKPPPERAEWAGGSDSEYQDLVRAPLHENRKIVLPLQTALGAAKNVAYDRLGALRDKLVKASKTRGGIPLTWTPHGSTRTVTFDVLAGEVTDLPLNWLHSSKSVVRPTITLTCKPYWRGTKMDNYAELWNAHGPALGTVTQDFANLRAQPVGIDTPSYLQGLNIITDPKAATTDALWSGFASSGAMTLNKAVADGTTLGGTCVENVTTGVTTGGHTVLISRNQFSPTDDGQVKPGTRVLLRVRVKVHAATAAVTNLSVARRLSVAGVTAVFDQANVANQGSPVTGTWYDLAAITTVPATGTILNMDARITVGAPGDFTIRAERWQMVILDATSGDPGYFDGDQPNGRWIGTPNASPSARGTDPLLDWTFDLGAGSAAALNGVLVPSSTAAKILYWSARPYPFEDVEISVKFHTGASAAGMAGLVLARLDANNELRGRTMANGTGIQIFKLEEGTEVALSSAPGFVLAVNTTYWLRFRAEDNLLTLEAWTAAPSPTGTPAASTTYTLTGNDAARYGAGAVGDVGIYTQPAGTDWTYDDFLVLPNVYQSTAPLLSGTPTNMNGDVAALGDLYVIDGAAQARRFADWGLEPPETYVAGTPLILDSDSLVTTGFAGAQATVTGSYDPNAAGTNAITSTIAAAPQAICGTGTQLHQGSFRVKARVTNVGPSLVQSVRLAWRVEDGVYLRNAPASVTFADRFGEIDLGTIVIPTGAASWDGVVEAWAPATDDLTVDYLLLVPTGAGYGKAVGAYSYSPGAVTARDSFFGTTAGVALGVRTPDVGGAWATSGVATDFTFVDVPREAIHRFTTGEASARFAIIDALVAKTDMEVHSAFYLDGYPSATGEVRVAVVARWTDASNYVRATFIRNYNATTGVLLRTFEIQQVVAGTPTILATMVVPAGTINSLIWYQLRIIVFASGRVIATVLDEPGTTAFLSLEANNAALATGGALASGKGGIYDINTSASVISRDFDDVTVATPTPEPIVMYSGRYLRVTDAAVTRQNAAASGVGRPSSYLGSRFLLPVGTSRLVARARRQNVEQADDGNVTDLLRAQVLYTPRGLVVPR